MKLLSLHIQNFKSIKDMKITDIENTLILVGKNNVGKTVLLDALRILTDEYKVQTYDFNEFNQKIIIELELELIEEDLENLYNQGKVSNYKKYILWKQDFTEKIPSFNNNKVFIQCNVSTSGKIRYSDGINKNNEFIKEVLPEFHMIDHRRDIKEIQDSILKFHGNDPLEDLRKNRCLFDNVKECKKCFNCIGIINKKKPEDLSIQETAKLMEYKLYHLNLKKYTNRLNYYMRKNGNIMYDIEYQIDVDFDQAFNIQTMVYNKENRRQIPIERISEGIRSLFILALFEAYSEDINKVSSIIIIEAPELYLHPQLQKIASQIIYRLSKKNQVIFTTHSPNMLFNFSSKQIRQLVLERDYTTKVAEITNLDFILEDLGFTANDLMNVNFVFIVEGKQDRNRLPLLLEKYYSEVQDENGNLKRIAIIPTNSCTNIKTYANLKFINKTYLKDNFIMIRDSDGKDPELLKNQLCHYYKKRAEQDGVNIPRITPKNVLILKYYSFENYFLNPKVMEKIGVISSEEEFFDILYEKYKQYLYRLRSTKVMFEKTGIHINSKEDIKKHLETIKIYVRGHNLFNIFYGRYKSEERDILKRYIDEASREDFKDILSVIDSFIYFENRKKQ